MIPAAFGEAEDGLQRSTPIVDNPATRSTNAEEGVGRARRGGTVPQLARRGVDIEHGAVGG